MKYCRVKRVLLIFFSLLPARDQKDRSSVTYFLGKESLNTRREKSHRRKTRGEKKGRKKNQIRQDII